MKLKSLLLFCFVILITVAVNGQNKKLNESWTTQTLDGLTLTTPMPLEKEYMPMTEAFAKLLSRLNMYLAVDDDVAIIYNFMEFKAKVDYHLENGLKGAVANSIKTMAGTDLSFKTRSDKKDKLAMKGSGDFLKDGQKVHLESFGYWNEDKHVIMVIALAFTNKGRAMADKIISSAKVANSKVEKKHQQSSAQK